MRPMSRQLSLMLAMVFLAPALLIACSGTPVPAAAPTPRPTIAVTATSQPATTQPVTSTIAASATTPGTPVPSQTASVTPTVGVTATLFFPTAVTQIVLKAAQNPQLGNLLTDAQGMTLYTFKSDTPDSSSCTGDCATLWPPLTVGFQISPAAAPGIPGYVGVFERPGNMYQVTYNDAALYGYSKDTKPGDTNGNGLNGLWSVVVIPPQGSTPSSSPAVPSASPTSAGK